MILSLILSVVSVGTIGATSFESRTLPTPPLWLSSLQVCGTNCISWDRVWAASMPGTCPSPVTFSTGPLPLGTWRWRAQRCSLCGRRRTTLGVGSVRDLLVTCPRWMRGGGKTCRCLCGRWSAMRACAWSLRLFFWLWSGRDLVRRTWGKEIIKSFSRCGPQRRLSHNEKPILTSFQLISFLHKFPFSFEWSIWSNFWSQLKFFSRIGT